MCILQLLNYEPYFEGRLGITGTDISNLIFDTMWMQFVSFTTGRVSPT